MLDRSSSETELCIKLESEKISAYRERNIVVAILSRSFPSYLSEHAEDESGWDQRKGWVVYIELPTGQVSWHVERDELAWFSHLAVADRSPWDGHNEELKWTRVSEYMKRK